MVNGLPPGEQLEKDHAKTVDVALLSQLPRHGIPTDFRVEDFDLR